MFTALRHYGITALVLLSMSCSAFATDAAVFWDETTGKLTITLPNVTAGYSVSVGYGVGLGSNAYYLSIPGATNGYYWGYNNDVLTSDVKKIEVVGGSGPDTIDVGAISSDPVYWDPVLNWQIVLRGNGGDDSFMGSSLNDIVYGGNGKDYLFRWNSGDVAISAGRVFDVDKNFNTTNSYRYVSLQSLVDAQSLAAGDWVRVRARATPYNEKVTINGPFDDYGGNDGGSAGNPVVIEGYLGTPEFKAYVPLAADNSFADGSGVVNLVNTQEIKLVGLKFTNTKPFQPGGGRINETSCALNISRSKTITLENVTLRGGEFGLSPSKTQGKGAAIIHSDSDVVLNNSNIHGGYHELTVAASRVTAANTTLHHELWVNNPNTGTLDRDSHSAIWTSSSYRRPYKTIPNALFNHPTSVALTGVTFKMNTGRPIVTGNGSPALLSVVTLTNPSFAYAAGNNYRGLVGYHEDWFSIDLRLNTPIPGLVGFVTTVTTNWGLPTEYQAGPGFGRFVNYYNPIKDDWLDTTPPVQVISDGLHGETLNPNPNP